MTTRITHASVLAEDLEASAAFYEELLDMERVPAPNFPDVDVVWLQCGDRTLHLFDRDVEAAEFYHVGFHVDDFERVFDAVVAEDLGARSEGGSPTVYVLPDGAVQLYVRDPTGNLVEVNYHDVDDLPERVREATLSRADQVPQTGDAADARLYPDGLLEEVGGAPADAS